MVKLNYEEFKEFCAKNVVKALGEEKYDAVPRPIRQTDEIVIDSVQIMEKGMTGGPIPSFRVEPFYSDYCNGKALGEVLREILKSIERFLTQPLDVADVSIFDAFDKAKKNLIIRPISYTDNEILLNEHIYKRIGDIAVVLYMLMHQSDTGIGSAKVPRGTVEKWGLSDDFLMQVALENTAHLFPPFILPLEKSFLGVESFSRIPIQNRYFMKPMLRFKLLPSMLNTYIMFIDKSVNGASSVFYPGALERVASLLNDDLYLSLPCICEALIHHASQSDPDELHHSAKRVMEGLDPLERLSPFIYHYSRSDQKLRMLEAY